MSVATELNRIISAKADIKTAVANKGVTIPDDKLIDDYAGYIDQIQTGGQENLFMQSTNLGYMFYERDLTTPENFDGFKRFSQNNITNLHYAFRYAKCDEASKINECLEYLKKIFTNTTLTDMSYALYSFSTPTYYETPQDIPVLDLSNLKINGNAEYAFYNIMFSSSSDRKYFKVKFKKGAFSDCTSLQYTFHNSQFITNLTYIFEDNEIDCSNCTNCAYMFSEFKGHIEDFNGNSNNILNLKMNQSGTYSLYGAFSSTNLERINFDNTALGVNFTNTFSNCTNLKSVTGLNFEGSTVSSSFNPFGTNNLFSFGELGIINGSTLGTTNGKNMNIKPIWNANKSTIRDGQTIEYWYEKFANALGNKAATGTQTITISSALYNSLTQAQIELITNKGYALASA